MTYMKHHTECFLHSLGKRWYVKSRYHVCRYIKQINKYLIPITANITMIVHVKEYPSTSRNSCAKLHYGNDVNVIS